MNARSDTQMHFSYNLSDKSSNLTEKYKSHINRINERQRYLRCDFCDKIFNYRCFSEQPINFPFLKRFFFTLQIILRGLNSYFNSSVATG